MHALAALVSAAALASGGTHVAVQPAAAARDGMIRVAVTGVTAPAASVRIRGGLASRGRWFGWVPLIPTGPGSWRTVLRAPGFLGVYPVEVRAGGRIVDSNTFVRILPRGFAARPGFAKPALVAEWWARLAPPGATIRSVATWRRGFFTHRDARLNRLLVVRYDLLGAWPQQDLRRGAGTIYLSIARLGYAAPWRLLETVRAP